LKTLEIYERDQIFSKAAITGRYFQSKLHTLKSHILIGDVRGRGLLGAVELVANKTTKRPFDGGDVGAFMVRACEKKGLILRAVAGNSIAFCPPLIITKAQIDELFDKFEVALGLTLDYAKRQGLLV
jgi:4-aminobutyrate--pyruvate transaminase